MKEIETNEAEEETLKWPELVWRQLIN
jgi:hypothetical protein